MQILNISNSADRFSSYLVSQSIIKSEKQALYAFGIRQLTDMVLSGVVTLVLSGIFNMLLEGVLFFLLYIMLRVYAGGYHAKTRRSCYLISLFLFITALAGMNLLKQNMLLSVGIGLCSGLVIMILAPVETSKKPLRDSERKVYRKRAMMFVIGYSLLSAIAAMLGDTMLPAVVAIVLVLLSTMLLLQKWVDKMELE